MPVSCIQVGRMVKVKQDSYCRVYNDDGTFHYPHIAANLLRKKGTEYFAPVELTGKAPKMSLLSKKKGECHRPGFAEKSGRSIE